MYVRRLLLRSQLACALYLFWYLRGHFSEAREWYERFLGRFHRNEMSTSLHAELLWNAALVAWRQGDYAAADRYSGKSVELGRNRDHDPNTVMALAVRGLVACHQSLYSIAHAAVEQIGRA